MLSINKVFLTCSFLALSISPLKAGSWYDLMEKGEGEKAREMACAKYHKYCGDYYGTALPKIGKITNYITTFLPHLSADAVSFGVNDFFEKKINKWAYKINLIDQFLNNPFASGNIAPQFKNRLDTNYKTSLPYACQKSVEISFQQQAITGLEEIGAHAKAQTNLDPEIGLSVENLLKVLKVNQVSKEIERLQKLHTSLNNKLLGLMGIEPEDLAKPFEKPSIVNLIDSPFKKYLKGVNGWDIPYGIENQRPLPFPDNVLEWGHGDTMAGLIKFFSPQSEIIRIYSPTLPLYALFQNKFLPKNASIVFNCSFVTNSPRYSIRKEGQNTVWTYNQAQIESVKYCKQYLANKFPSENCNGPLSDNQVAYLQENESTEIKLDPVYTQYFAAGLNGEKDNLLIASPINTSGALVKTGFHDGIIQLLDKDLTKEHGLVALNWDITTNALYTDSKSAGEYKDMAVVVPSAYVSVADNQTTDKIKSVPYFIRGGHSSATSILSAVTSCVRGHYPELTYMEVKRAILDGANKNIPGYREDLHGQGMLNLTGALAEAKKIMSERKAENSSI